MAARLTVIDASALGALLFGESRAEEVAERIGDGRLVAPTLVRYEVASVCLKKITRRPRLREKLLRALALLDRLDLRELPVSHADVVARAGQTGLTTYDASYLWLAESLDAELITLDEKLHRAFIRPE